MKTLRWYWHQFTKALYFAKLSLRCYDYDASSVHILIHGQLDRVSRFMNSDDTHLMWNDSQTKGMKRLAELTELAKRMSHEKMDSGVSNLDKYYEDYDTGLFNPEGQTFFHFNKRFSIAHKKDKAQEDQLKKRYYYLMEKYMEGFWD